MKRFLDKKQHRFKGFDYSQDGCYFVTTKTKNRIDYLGEIIDGNVKLSQIGKIAQKCW